jgi:hypothetical protein
MHQYKTSTRPHDTDHVNYLLCDHDDQLVW